MNTYEDTKNVPAASQPDKSPPIIDYEGSDYRERFWQGQGREYEDLAERIALRKLLPPRGRRLVEIGAGFGRTADLYNGYDQVILLDYSRSLLRQAQARWGNDPRFLFVAANVYSLPLAEATADVAVMVRVMHHLADVPAALAQIRWVLVSNGAFVAEYASKRHLKAIARYALRRQAWSPFDLEPFEFVPLNFDFHPTWMAHQFRAADFLLEQELAVSHFRLPLLKRLVSPRYLAAADGAVQQMGARWKLTPSIFVRCRVPGSSPAVLPEAIFCCPHCRSSLQQGQDSLDCPVCGRRWPVQDGLYDFKTPNDIS